MKIAFVCIHNSCRSQMAEGLARALAPKEYEIFSAGTEKYPEVKPLAIKAMEDRGIRMDDHYPKLLEDIPNELDVLITMGCGVECPFVPSRFREDWGLDDPSGGPYEAFVNTRNIIEAKVKQLLLHIEDNSLFTKANTINIKQ